MRDYSNYHNTDFNAKVAHDGNVLFEYGLNGFDGYDITVNGVVSRALIISKYSNSDGTEKNIVGKIADIERGNVIKVNYTDENWLIMTVPTDNKVYRKAVIKLCNSTYTLPGTTTKTQTGENSFGEPIYTTTTTEPTLLPCIAETTVTSDNSDEAVNLPTGQIQITITYTEHDAIGEGKNFTMYNNQYETIGIDRTKSINGIGLLVIKGKKV